MAISARAKELKAQGHDVISFGVGEPDFDTPPHIKDAAIQAIRDGFTKYTPGGLPELKEAVVEAYKRDHGLDYDVSQVIVSDGAKQVLYNLCQALLDEGDEVLLPAPYWVTYPAQFQLAGAKTVILPTEPGTRFCITPDQLAQAITPRTKILLLNSPSNPTGTYYSAEQLAALAAVTSKHGIYVLSDEVYSQFIYDTDARVSPSFAGASDAAKELTFTIDAVSKTYAMTGWRIGYAAGPSDVIKAATKLQGQSTSHPCSIAQKAAVAALLGDQTCVQQMRREYDRRRRRVVELLNDIEGISCVKPDAAFYAFPDVSACFGRAFGAIDVTDSATFCTAVLEQAHVALVPGAAFGADRCVRMHYATSIDRVEEALHRIKELLLSSRTGPRVCSANS